MTKSLLAFDLDLDFVLIAISCHQKDYRLSWFLNNALEINLSKAEDFQPIAEGGAGFPRYEYIDDLSDLHYTLIGNISSGTYFLGEHRQADFFVKMEGNVYDQDIEDVVNKIKDIEVVIMAYEVDLQRLKDPTQLIFE